MERVSIIEGELPVLIIAPHGCDGDDDYTAFIAEQLATHHDYYAVINRGWKKADKVNIFNSEANCNDIEHCRESVVNEEFLIPVRRYIARITKQYGEAYIFLLHGVGNYIRDVASDPSLDMIIGHGAGGSLSCSEKLKNAFLEQLDKAGIRAREATAGSMMSGRSKRNLNQYFKQWDYNSMAHSLQVEIIKELREDDAISQLCADVLGKAIDDFLLVDDTTIVKFIPRKY